MIGAVASITFGWLMTGRYVWAAAGLSALDWFLINLANKVTDIEEDLRNGIQGTERVVRWKSTLEAGVLLVWSWWSSRHLLRRSVSRAMRSSTPIRRGRRTARRWCSRRTGPGRWISGSGSWPAAASVS